MKLFLYYIRIKTEPRTAKALHKQNNVLPVAGVLPAYRGQMPIWNVQQEHPTHI